MARPRIEPTTTTTEFNPKNLPVVKQVRFHAGVEQLKMAQSMETGPKRLILEDSDCLIFISKTEKRVVKVSKPQCKSWEMSWDEHFKTQSA